MRRTIAPSQESVKALVEKAKQWCTTLSFFLETVKRAERLIVELRKIPGNEKDEIIKMKRKIADIINKNWRKHTEEAMLLEDTIDVLFSNIESKLNGSTKQPPPIHKELIQHRDALITIFVECNRVVASIAITG